MVPLLFIIFFPFNHQIHPIPSSELSSYTQLTPLSLSVILNVIHKLNYNNNSVVLHLTPVSSLLLNISYKCLKSCETRNWTEKVWNLCVASFIDYIIHAAELRKIITWRYVFYSVYFIPVLMKKEIINFQ